MAGGQTKALQPVPDSLGVQPRRFTASFLQTIGRGRDFMGIGELALVTAERQGRFQDNGLGSV